MTETPPPPPPDETPISGGQTLALGCAGFVLFFVAAGIVALGFGAGPAGGIVLFVALVGVAIAYVRGADRRTRAKLGRAAIGFGIAAVIFGACLASFSNMDFR